MLPVDGRGTQRVAEERPQISGPRQSYTYYQGPQVVPGNAAANVLNRTHSITVDAEVPKGGAEGVLYSMGGVDGGFSLYIKGGKLKYVYNYVAAEFFYLESTEAVTEGRHKFRFEFEATGKPDMLNGKGSPGTAKLYIDEKQVGEMKLPYTIPLSLGLGAGAACGCDPGSPTCDDYDPPFAYTGKIYSATVDVSGELIEDHEAKAKQILARQ